MTSKMHSHSQKSLIKVSKEKSQQSSNMRVTSRIFTRKKSFGFGFSPGVGKPVDTRASQLAFEFKRPPWVFLPTFQINSYHPFHVEHVTALAEDVMGKMFAGHKYSAQDSPTLALQIAGEAMRGVKEYNYNRYRIIAVCTLAQKRAQSYNNTISFIWDGERDKYVDVHGETQSAFCQLTIFGVYLD